MLESLAACCKKLGLTISCKKTKTLAVLPPDSPADLTPTPIHLLPGEEPIEVVFSFQYLGSTIQQDCSLDCEINSRICKDLRSLYRVLWLQRKSRVSTKLRLFNSVILPTFLYVLEAAVLLELQIHRLASSTIRCLRIPY